MKNLTAPLAARVQQRGAVMLLSLIILVVLLLSAVALVRSFDTALFSAGNLAFKRDLANQGERAIQAVIPAFQTGALNTPAERAAHLQASNYRASILPSNAQGIPLALLSDGAFAAVATGADIAVAGQGVTVRYVVDRMCTDIGIDTVLGADRCSFASNQLPNDSSGNQLQNAAIGSAGGAGAVQQQVVYRISIRVTGPRDTQSFYQTTFTL